MDLLSVIQQYINFKAVLLAVAVTQAIKFYVLPSPGPERSAEVVPGRLTTRLLPLFAILIAFIATFLLERDSLYTLDDGVRGVMSGVFASYSYRTAKVSLFGE